MNKHLLITLALVSINSFTFGMKRTGLFAKSYGSTKKSPKKPSELSEEARMLIQAGIAKLEAEDTKRAAEEAARPIDLTLLDQTFPSPDYYADVIQKSFPK